MKKYTTLLCLLLALVMVMACFTGCAKQPAQSDPADTTELRRQLTPPLRIPPRLNPPTRAKRSTSALPSSATTSTISTAMPTTPSRPPSSRPSA